MRTIFRSFGRFQKEPETVGRCITLTGIKKSGKKHLNLNTFLQGRFDTWVFLIYACLSLGFLALGITKPVASVKNFLYYLISPSLSNAGRILDAGEGFPNRLSELVRSHRENQQLKTLLQPYHIIETQLKTLRTENERLRELLNFSSPPSYMTVAAGIMTRTPEIWFDSLMLDRGSDAGLVINAPVVTLSHGKTNLAGRIVELSGDSSKVLLLTSRYSAVTANLGNGDEIGVVRGGGGSELVLDYISVEANMKAGDSVTTAGLGGYFPPGLDIGHITGVLAGGNMFKSAKVRPAAEFSRMREVIVLVPEKVVVAPKQK